ncbi:MAG TPA: hypothetical protein VMU18_06205 [Rhodoblastus sp.]|nr:hypothetical protein [Rhodoblastus sp.]
MHARSRRRLVALALSLVLSLDAATALAKGGAFADFAGTFVGRGVAKTTDGAKEVLSCRATGASAGEGRALSQNIACESATFKFDLSGLIVAEGAEARGQWRETTRGLAGDVSGRIVGPRFSGVSAVKGFAGRFSFHVGPRKLIFAFWPDDANMPRLRLSLDREDREDQKQRRPRGLILLY